ERSSYDQGLVSGAAPFGSWRLPGQPNAPTYKPRSDTGQPNTSSPHLTSEPTAQGPRPPRFEGYPILSSLQRPPSQPIGPPAALRADQRPWSPAFVPSRPATTLGVPGILGEGIYKVSKIGPASSGRPRVRRTTAVFEHQGPRMYTISKPFDKSISKIDALHATRGWHPRQRLSSSLQDDPIRYVTRPSTLGVSKGQTPGKLGEDHQASETYGNMSSSLEGFSVDKQRPARIRRLVTIDNASYSRQPSEFDEKIQQSPLFNAFEETRGHVPPKSESSQNNIDDAIIFSSSPTLFESPTDPDMTDDWLLQVSQAQHQGLAQASSIWDDFVEKASKDMASAEPSDGLADILSKYENEFAERWNGVVVATAHQMREHKKY
ncbi:hypothetical protein MYCTH_53690, partial [Thermothelomyces thermophilus ATCC 42464]